MAGLKTYFHEHVHSLGKWKAPVPKGRPPPGHAYAELATTIGAVLELTTIVRYRAAMKRIGFKVPSHARCDSSGEVQ